MEMALPATARVITLFARQIDRDTRCWSHPVALESPPHGEPLALTPRLAPSPADPPTFTATPAAGPFLTEDAWEFTLAPKAPIELATLPWDGGPAPVVSGWYRNSRSPARISLSYRSEDGAEISTQNLSSQDAEMSHLPYWRRFETTARFTPPSDAASVVLVIRSPDVTYPTSLPLSGLRVVRPAPITLPAGFTRIGRVPGQITLTATAGSRLAVHSPSKGVGVVDLTSGQFSGWIPLAEPPSRAGKPAIWMGLAGDRIACLPSDANVIDVSLKTRTARPIYKVHALVDSRRSSSPIQLSPDGKLLAIAGAIAGIRIIELDENGVVGNRLFDASGVRSLTFTDTSFEAVSHEKIHRLDLQDWRNATLITSDRPQPQNRPAEEHPDLSSNGSTLKLPAPRCHPPDHHPGAPARLVQAGIAPPHAASRQPRPRPTPTAALHLQLRLHPPDQPPTSERLPTTALNRW